MHHFTTMPSDASYYWVGMMHYMNSITDASQHSTILEGLLHHTMPYHYSYLVHQYDTIAWLVAEVFPSTVFLCCHTSEPLDLCC